MGNQTINFRIQSSNLHTGTAVIVNSYADGVKYVEESDEIEHSDENAIPEIGQTGLRTREIGLFEGYKIYENYYDSGSDDYVYFAVPLEMAQFL